jgi:hypothetical protein
MTDEQFLARELATMVKQHVADVAQPLRDRIAELERRLAALEAANAMRNSVEQLAARVDRIEAYRDEKQTPGLMFPGESHARTRSLS